MLKYICINVKVFSNILSSKTFRRQYIAKYFHINTLYFLCACFAIKYVCFQNKSRTERARKKLALGAVASASN